MGIRIVAVGQRIVDWADTAVRDYLGRFPREFPVSLVEIRTEPRNGRTPAQLMKAEAEHILAKIEDDDWVVVLDEHGKDATTRPSTSSPRLKTTTGSSSSTSTARTRPPWRSRARSPRGGPTAAKSSS